MFISMEEEHKIVEYQETMKVEVEIFAKNIFLGRKYMKLLIIHFLQQKSLFRQNFKTNVKKFK